MNAHTLQFTASDIAAATGRTERGVRKRAKGEAWPFVVEKRSRRYAMATLPADVQAALVECLRTATPCDASASTTPAADKRAEQAWKAFEHAKGWRKAIAERRQSALFEVAALRAGGASLADARAQVADALKAQRVNGSSVSALKRWGRDVRDVDRRNWLPFLLPGERGRKPRARIHPAAWRAFKRDWLRPEKPTIAMCYRRVVRLADTHTEWKPLPSLDTFERRCSDVIERAARIMAREGKEALLAAYAWPSRDRSHLVAMQSVNSDGHKFDVAVRYPDGTIGRPIILGWQDLASGKIVGWRVGSTETSDLVRLSFADMVRKFGIPQHAYLDNGRAYASKKNTGGTPTRYRFKVREEEPKGVITRLGVTVHWTRPYNGKAKPIERAWGDLARDISKRKEFAGAYLGNNPMAKPENYGSRAVPLDEFLRVVADGIAEHNARQGRRGGVCAGRSFDDTFNESYAQATVKKASKEQLSRLLLASQTVTVNRVGSVTLCGNRYADDGDVLVSRQGERVEIRFDPEDMHGSVHIFAGDDYLCEAACVAAVGYDSEDAAKRGARAQRKVVKKARELLDAQLERDAAASPTELPPIATAEQPSASVVALHFPARKAAPSALAPGDGGAEPSILDGFITQWMDEQAKNAL